MKIHKYHETDNVVYDHFAHYDHFDRLRISVYQVR